MAQEQDEWGEEGCKCLCVEVRKAQWVGNVPTASAMLG